MSKQNISVMSSRYNFQQIVHVITENFQHVFCICDSSALEINPKVLLSYCLSISFTVVVRLCFMTLYHLHGYSWTSVRKKWWRNREIRSSQKWNRRLRAEQLKTNNSDSSTNTTKISRNSSTKWMPINSEWRVTFRYQLIKYWFFINNRVVYICVYCVYVYTGCAWWLNGCVILYLVGTSGEEASWKAEESSEISGRWFSQACKRVWGKERGRTHKYEGRWGTC